jgi:exodeoxyribonuclease VII large subunit
VDFVADMRAPTPSAAAELATPELADLAALVAEARARLDSAATSALATRRALVNEAARSVALRAPLRQIGRDRQQIDDLLRRIERAFSRDAELRRVALSGLGARLATLSPQATLARGYAVVRRATDGVVLTSPTQARPGTRLQITLRDGTLDAEAAAPAPEERR